MQCHLLVRSLSGRARDVVISKYLAIMVAEEEDRQFSTKKEAYTKPTCRVSAYGGFTYLQFSELNQTYPLLLESTTLSSL